ncbi:hypothetical protein [Mycoplana ramosa]|uniref:DUF3618 domain-containing protein n=1 Tax=Mycoplana ramosa TaxID=40837 RepID=A0ABW3YYT5_MYCRA
MTNIRTHGFDSPAQLREHWAELEDDALEAIRAGEAERQLAKLRREIGLLRSRLAERKTAVLSIERNIPWRSTPWLWAAGAMAAAVVVSTLLHRR